MKEEVAINYLYDPVKNKRLKEERGVNFEDVIVAIEQGCLLDVRLHHNADKYPHQKIIVVEIDGYACLVPFIQEADQLILKTVYPSRKATALYLESRGEQ